MEDKRYTVIHDNADTGETAELYHTDDLEEAKGKCDTLPYTYINDGTFSVFDEKRQEFIY